MGSLVSRAERMFDAFSEHGTYITFESYTRQGRALAELRGEDPGSPRISALTSELENMWAMLLAVADVNKDGRVDREEFMGGVADMSASLQNVAPDDEWIMDPYFRLLFDVIDGDSDGRITRTEYADWLRSLGMAADADIDGAFASCDKDGNGAISLNEFSECGRNYWTREGMSITGARWLGP